jgi:hypothetical protein
MQLGLPSSPATNLYIFGVFKANMIKFRKFTESILNPATMADLISKFGKVNPKEVD